MGGRVLEYEAKAIREEGIEKGIEKGIAEGIKGTVSILKKLEISPQTIMQKLQEQYHLDPEEAKKYLL